MRLHRLKIEQLRQFRQPFEILGFESGLNLFVGPNEAGKSTIVRAIRAAFFERHRSVSVDDLLPWGESSAAPSVEIDFSIGTDEYQLRKSFLQRKRCELKFGSKDLDGEDAEQYLSDLFGFSFSGKGASRPEHWGIPGLLWIEQGSAQDVAESVGNATDYLRKALDQSVGEVASSQGDDVINRVRADREVLLTTKGRPRGVYAEASIEREAAEKRVDDLDFSITRYRQQVDELGQLRAQNATDAAAKPWEGFRAQMSEAEGRLSTIRAMTLQLDADNTSLKQFEDNLKLVEEQLAGFDEQHRALKGREADVLSAERHVQISEASNETWSATRRHAETTYQEATEALAIARQEDLRADLTRRISEATKRVTEITDSLAKASAEQKQLAAYRKLAVELEIQKSDITHLREQHAALNELRIRQEAAATRLRFDIRTEANVTLAGQPLSGIGEQLITTGVELDIPDVGRLQIVPGGGDLLELARDEAAQRAAQIILLQRIGVPSLVEAETRYATYQQALKDIKHSEKVLANLAPKGIDHLHAELNEYAARKAEAEGQVAQMGEPIAASDRPPETLTQAIAQQKAANTHLEKIAQQAADAKLALGSAVTQRDAALRERDALRGLINDPSRQQRARETGQRLLVVRAERDGLEKQVSTRQAELANARPDILAQDVQRFKRSAEHSERAFNEQKTSMTLLQGKLEEGGAQGLEEERAEQAVLAHAADRRYKELKLRADALELLLNLLESKRRALTKRLQAPLQKHVNRYLQLLFPQAKLDIGEDLTPALLIRVGCLGSESGPVGELSFGAREQMGVISRLAYADLLKEAGRPTLIILDDALVHSDDQRLEQMKRVLFDAAQRHQVLLFTCHPAAWRDMGAIPRTIARTTSTLASDLT